MSTALIVIDVQQGLCEGETACFAHLDTIARINTVAAKCRAAGVPVIFIQHESPSGSLQFGSDSWQLADGLDQHPGDICVRKTTSDAFLRTELADTLARLHARELVICGMQTQYCVDTTTRRALALGFPVILIEDGHTTENGPHLSAAQIIAHHNHTLTNIGSFGNRVSAVSTEAFRVQA